jgi:quinol monooxygenase YgiN
MEREGVGRKVILVEFAVRPEFTDHARQLILANAALSLQEEPGCLRFDVLVSSDDPARIILYEIYESAGAFDAHLKMPHFLEFSEATREMFAARIIRSLDFLNGAYGDPA